MGPRGGVFAVRTRGKWGESKKHARKMGREKKGGGRGVGEGKEGKVDGIENGADFKS